MFMCVADHTGITGSLYKTKICRNRLDQNDTEIITDNIQLVFLIMYDRDGIA